MSPSKPVFSLPRGLQAVALVACVVWQAAVGRASVVPAARVVAVHGSSSADLVILGGGFDAGLRQGMVCRVTRGSTEVAEVLLVDLRPACSSALILNVAARQAIRPGDVASIKILKS